jgi:hypothetical protein
MKLVFEDIGNLHNFKSCPDVNPSGIKRFTYAPLINATNMFFSFSRTESFLKFIEFNPEVENYIIPAAVNHSPDDWTGYNDKVKSLFEYLNPKYIKDLRNKKALLLLDQSFEGYQTSWLWDFFHTHCKQYDVSPSSIIYVTGNMIADETYEKFCYENDIQDKMKVIPYAHFELDVGMTCYHMDQTGLLPNFNTHLNYKKKNKKNIKTFSCLNKRIRPHRVWFYKYMFENDIIKDGLVSMNEFSKHQYPFENNLIDLDVIDKISENLPLLIYDKRNNELDDNYYIRRLNEQICLDSFISVVSEAHCGDSDETMFLSEKLFKPIACRHPWMVMGNKDSLSMMKKLGYKTFSNFVNEDYDSLPTHERMLSIIESIKKVIDVKDKIEWYESTREIVEHNHKNLIDKLYKLPESFVEVLKYYNEYFTGEKNKLI